MEATRTASFDDKMYLECATTIDRTLEESLIESITNGLERIEKQIADSHDITKSNFGFKP